MKKEELVQLIRNEVVSCVKQELPKIIRPMVQEAVAGALASIIAEGIVKGAPQNPIGSSNTTIREGEQPKNRLKRPAQSIPEDASAQKRILRERFQSAINVPEEKPYEGNFDILTETARDMQREGWSPGQSFEPATPSVLDDFDADAVADIARNYSNIMDKLNLKK